MAMANRRLRRFTRTERAVHWVHATAFVILLATGLGLYLPSLAEAVGRRPPQGRLNAGQKVNAILTAVFALLFALTGFFLWYGERNTRFRMPNALLVHDWLMYVSFFLFMGHLYLSLIYPKTRHALNGITRGWVHEDWALQHHRKWVEEMREP